MDKESLSQFKARLTRSEAELEEKLAALQKVPDFGDDGVDPDIETEESEGFGNQLSMAQALKSQLIAVKDALGKIDFNNYGICENCHKNISMDLLELVPESRLCQDCKKSSQ